MVELQPFSLDDAETLIGWAVTPEFLLQWVGPTFEYPLDRAQLERHLLETEGATPSILAFKLVEPSCGEMVGFIELCAIDRRNRSANLGRVIVRREERGRG